MSSEKEKEALAGTQDEKKSLKDGDVSADGSLPGMNDDTTFNADMDNSRARFIANNHEKGDAAEVPEVYVDVEGKTKQLENQFMGLTKDELMKYADDPYWKKVRLALLILFWVGWFGMLVAAIIIIVLAPRCPPRPKLDWWQKGSVYQLHTESFQDSNGDGIGDIQGVHDRLNYLQGKPDSLNVSSLWLSPIYPHGGTSSGYDITDFKGISEEFGTFEEFDSFKVSLHKRNLKLILDFIPNHTGKTHPWFTKSQNKEEGYEDFYVWAAGSEGNLPNTWKNQVGGAAWEYDTTRGEYYYNSFGPDQPDLNLRNADVLRELEDALDFWLTRGVDGFVVKGAAFLFECQDLTEEDESCTVYQPETYDLITHFREQMDTFTEDDDRVRFLYVDVPQGAGNQTTAFYTAGANMVTNTALLDIDADCRAQCLYEKINGGATDTAWNSWQTGNQDTSRILSRLGGDQELINVINLILHTLPGTPFAYYGEEIGMSDLSSPQTGPNAYRGIMQWTNGDLAGFTEGNTTWLPLPDDYSTVNVKTQLAHGYHDPPLVTFSKLLELRQEPSMQWGTLTVGTAGKVLFYVRQAEGFGGYLIAINFGPGADTVDFVTNSLQEGLVPAEGKVVLSTTTDNEHFAPDVEVDLSNVLLQEKQGVLFTWAPK